MPPGVDGNGAQLRGKPLESGCRERALHERLALEHDGRAVGLRGLAHGRVCGPAGLIPISE